MTIIMLGNSCLTRNIRLAKILSKYILVVRVYSIFLTEVLDQPIESITAFMTMLAIGCVFLEENV